MVTDAMEITRERVLEIVEEIERERQDVIV